MACLRHEFHGKTRDPSQLYEDLHTRHRHDRILGHGLALDESAGDLSLVAGGGLLIGLGISWAGRVTSHCRRDPEP